jgi:hypothetical protein
MNKTKVLALAWVLGAVCLSGADAQAPATLEEAEALSEQSGKPLLIKFFHQG